MSKTVPPFSLKETMSSIQVYNQPKKVPQGFKPLFSSIAEEVNDKKLMKDIREIYKDGDTVYSKLSNKSLNSRKTIDKAFQELNDNNLKLVDETSKFLAGKIDKKQTKNPTLTKMNVENKYFLGIGDVDKEIENAKKVVETIKGITGEDKQILFNSLVDEIMRSNKSKIRKTNIKMNEVKDPVGNVINNKTIQIRQQLGDESELNLDPDDRSEIISLLRNTPSAPEKLRRRRSLSDISPIKFQLPGSSADDEVDEKKDFRISKGSRSSEGFRSSDVPKKNQLYEELESTRVQDVHKIYYNFFNKKIPYSKIKSKSKSQLMKEIIEKEFDN